MDFFDPANFPSLPVVQSVAEKVPLVGVLAEHRALIHGRARASLDPPSAGEDLGMEHPL